MAKKEKAPDQTITGFIYARYSPGPQQTEASIEGQVRECKEYAKRNGIRIINIYSDSKQTGRNSDRAGFQQMLRDCKSGAVSVVLVWKIDRFGRNRAEIAQNRAMLKLAGVKVVSAMEHIPDTPEGIILESVLEGMAEYYSANLAENVRRGLKENALQCKANGAGQSLGYIVGDDRRYKIEPTEAAIVKRIFTEYDSGVKIADIWRGLNKDGIKTKRGKTFTQQGVARVLSNRAYIGEYRFGEITTPGGMPRIIDDDLFERVQNRRCAGRDKPTRRSISPDVDFLLTGKCICGHCKSTMRGTSGTGKSGRRFYYYACHNRQAKNGKCHKQHVRKEWLETEVTRLTSEYILTDAVIDFIADKVVALQAAEQADKSMLRYYESELKDTQTSLNNLLKAIEAGLFTETTKTRLFELEERKATLQAQIEKEKIVNPLIDKSQVVYFLHKFKGGAITDSDYQRQIIDIFVNQVIVYDDKLIITYNISGDRKTLTAEIIENAAENNGEVFDLTPVTSTECLKVEHVTFFFVGGVFGITSKTRKA